MSDMSQIQATPKHFLSWGFELHAGSAYLATVDMAWMGEGGSFEWRGQAYRLGRESWMSGNFFLKAGNQTLVTATKPSMFFREFHVQVGERELRLKAVSAFTRAFELTENGRAVGQIAPGHPFTRKCQIRLPQDFDIPVQVFLFWLVALMWRRADSD